MDDDVWKLFFNAARGQTGSEGMAYGSGGGASLLDKDRCVQHHESFRLQYQLQTSMLPCALTSSYSEEFTSPSAPLSSLKAIAMTDLILGKRHFGRVLYGRFCVKPFKVSSVNTVLEDSSGNGVRVAIYNVLLSTASWRDVEARFPLGTRVAFKEPFFKLCADRKPAVRVDNPADIVIDNCSERDSSPQDLSDAKLEEDLEVVRCEGNRLFAEENWTGAMNKYSECIDHATRKKETGTKINKSKSDKFNRVVMLAYSNRAEVRLRLQDYEEALCDADKALEFDPKNVKTLLRRGKAAHSMGQYEKACKAFKAALEIAPQQQVIIENLRASTTFYEQSENGIFDLSNYYSKGCTGAVPPCADFVGPVEIRRVRYGCGRRGLFATKNVEAGKLLLVSNPMAIARPKSDPNRMSVALNIQFKGTPNSKGTINTASQQDLIVKLAQQVMKSKRKIAQLYSLASYGKQEMEIPSMELFRPGSEWIPPGADKLEVDVGLIRSISSLNAFGYDDFNLKQIAKTGKDSHSGLWLLPSFANHSCAPNCLAIFIGDTLFFRPCRDIVDGEELTIPYFTSLFESRAVRQTFSRRWFFTCECERCFLEETLKPKLSKISKSIPGLVEAAKAEWSQDGHKRKAIKELAKLADDIEKALESRDPKLETKQQNWIRAALLDPFLSKYHLAIDEHDAQSRIHALTFVVDSMMSVAPSARALQLAALLLREVEQRYFKHSQAYRLTEEKVMSFFRIVFGKAPNKILLCLIRSHQLLPQDSGVFQSAAA